MLKRVMAWILLAGFVLLLLNLMMFHYYMMPSIAVYLVVAVWFIFTNKALPSNKKKKADKTDTEETSA